MWTCKHFTGACVSNPALLNALSSQTLADLYAAHGIADEPLEAPAKMVALSQSEQSVMLSAQAAIGVTGTRVIIGQIDVEQNYRVRPYFARGRIGRPGLLEDVYRSEPVLFNSLNSVTALVCNATYEPVIPEGADEQTKEICKRAHESIRYMKGGMRKFLQNASTAFRIGFAPFEIRWKDNYVYALEFREQATVDQWLFDAEENPNGASFMTMNRSYTLPMVDESASSARLLLVNIYATGNNLEGVSPVRVAIGLRKLKELLLSISGVSFQKYGVPIAQIITEFVSASAGDISEMGGAESVADNQRLANQLNSMDALTAPVLALPIGSKVDYATPTNAMPNMEPFIKYLDSLMALVMSNEGATLGSSSFGSYAMASVADDRFMRSAPVYASAVADSLTQLLHMMIKFNHRDPDSVTVWPEYSFRFAGTQDASRWAADMQVLVAAQVWTWPDEARRMAAANMGLSVEAFDEWVANTSPDVSGQQTAEVANGLD
jgi:hypothetical protein